ncbi:hypothetical protein Tco_0536182 [Tanacetum coccineum]
MEVARVGYGRGVGWSLHSVEGGVYVRASWGGGGGWLGISGAGGCPVEPAEARGWRAVCARGCGHAEGMRAERQGAWNWRGASAYLRDARNPVRGTAGRIGAGGRRPMSQWGSRVVPGGLGCRRTGSAPAQRTVCRWVEKRGGSGFGGHGWGAAPLRRLQAVIRRGWGRGGERSGLKLRGSAAGGWGARESRSTCNGECTGPAMAVRERAICSGERCRRRCEVCGADWGGGADDDGGRGRGGAVAGSGGATLRAGQVVRLPECGLGVARRTCVVLEGLVRLKGSNLYFLWLGAREGALPKAGGPCKDPHRPARGVAEAVPAGDWRCIEMAGSFLRMGEGGVPASVWRVVICFSGSKRCGGAGWGTVPGGRSIDAVWVGLEWLLVKDGEIVCSVEMAESKSGGRRYTSPPLNGTKKGVMPEGQMGVEGVASGDILEANIKKVENALFQLYDEYVSEYYSSGEQSGESSVGLTTTNVTIQASSSG